LFSKLVRERAVSQGLGKMRLGLVGPASGDKETLREAMEFLLGDADVDKVVYLDPDVILDQVLGEWEEEILGEKADEETTLRRVVELAQHGRPHEIAAFLAADAQLERLGDVCRIPPPPRRAVEIIDHRIILAVYDKAILDEEDIANAHLIVYGKG